jgi:integrase
VDKYDSGERMGREERMAPGVYARRGDTRSSLRIVFTFRGTLCRERLALEPTPPNVRYAVRLRGEILNAIERGTFNYADHFPESPLARRFGFTRSDRTIGTMLDEYEAVTARAVEASTWKGYKKVIERHLRPWFGSVRAQDLTAKMIQDEALRLSVSLKSIRNILSPLNIVLERAVAHGELETNPMDRVKLAIIWPLDQRATGWQPDPFSFEEMEAIFGACYLEEEADYWRFAFGTGLRPSEQIELRWPRVDMAGMRVRVEVARVTGLDGAALKGPKTEAGRRWIPCTAGAWEALQRQAARTAGEHVFLDARYDLPWQDEAILRKRWTRILKAAEVRYRNPYQTRHTFASALLAAGRPPLWLAKVMGHESTEMLERHYGRWIEQGQDPATRAALAAFFSHPLPTDGKVVAFPL